jgi:hypothetical protein
MLTTTVDYRISQTRDQSSESSGDFSSATIETRQSQYRDTNRSSRSFYAAYPYGKVLGIVDA